MAYDTLHIISDMWRLTSDTWHVAPDMLHVVEAEHSLKCQVSSFYDLGVMMEERWKLINESQRCL